MLANIFININTCGGAGHWNKKKGYTCMLAKHFPVLNTTSPPLLAHDGSHDAVPEKRQKTGSEKKDDVDELATMKVPRLCPPLLHLFRPHCLFHTPKAVTYHERIMNPQ